MFFFNFDVLSLGKKSQKGFYCPRTKTSKIIFSNMFLLLSQQCLVNLTALSCQPNNIICYVCINAFFLKPTLINDWLFKKKLKISNFTKCRVSHELVAKSSFYSSGSLWATLQIKEKAHFSTLTLTTTYWN